MFTDDQVKPASPEATALAEAIIKLLRADIDLEEETRRIPNYTGQWSHNDYVAREQEAWNRAADELYSVMQADKDAPPPIDETSSEMTLEAALAEIARLKTGIKKCDITMLVDGNDMADHGWMTIRDYNTRTAELRHEPNQ